MPSDLSSSDTDDTRSTNIDDDNTYIEKNFDPEIFFADNPRQCRYFKMIHKFFRKCDSQLVEKMVKIINKDKSNKKDDESSQKDSTCISLRVLEWVVTKCSKKNVDIQIDDKEYFSINIMYKAQLKAYKKKNFDPFRRDRKFCYKYDRKDPSKTVVTTLGQLNFFKWAISNNIIECVEKHYPVIIETMNKSNKDDKIKKLRKKKIKAREEESKSSKSLIKKAKSDPPCFIVEFD